MAQTDEPVIKPPKRRLKIEPEPAGQLEQLLVEYKKASDAAAAASEDEERYKKAIKAWLLDLFTNDPEKLPDGFDIVADPHGRYPGYSMTLKGVGSFRLDGTELQKLEPAKWVQYAKKVTPTTPTTPRT